jgi:predicted AAA+ superfamily ATPase
MKITRALLTSLPQSIFTGKVTILYGPRQVGKTTLAQDFLELPTTPSKHQFINADELVYRHALSSQDRRQLGTLVGDSELLVIDEAQRVPNIGLNLKILVDNYPQTAVLATGSASFELANQISEPLTGRALTCHLYPVSFPEIAQSLGTFEATNQLERWLVWGGYPAIVTTESVQLRQRLLGELVGAYLYRDILELDGLRHSEKLVDLLRLLAFQIGGEVSLTELGAKLSLNRQTVERYLDLLEKVFVIFKVRGLARNLRKEVSKTARYYFIDNGVRNSLIQNYNPLALRNDVGQLWENFLMVERRKLNAYAGRSVNSYFWRTYDQKEIDYVEETGGHLSAFEFKWQGQLRKSTYREFLAAYPTATLHTITPKNFAEFLTLPPRLP